MQEKLDAGQLRGIVIIPSDFSAKLQRGQTEHVVALQTDGAEPNTANFVSSYVQTIWMQWFTAYLQNRQTRSDQQIEIVPRYWFNPTTVSRNYLIPGAISVIMTIVGALLTSLVVAREWERGTMEALLSTPVTRMELLLSKVLPYYVLGIIAMTVCVLVATLLMRVPFRGSWFWLFIAGSLFLASALGLGLVLSSATRDQFNAAQSALNAAFLPAALFILDLCLKSVECQ